jgi:hypothetical protein
MNYDAAANAGASSDDSDATVVAWEDVQYYDGEAVILAPNYNGQHNVAALLRTKDFDAQGRKIWLLKIKAENARKLYITESQKLYEKSGLSREKAARVHTSLLRHHFNIA